MVYQYHKIESPECGGVKVEKLNTTDPGDSKTTST